MPSGKQNEKRKQKMLHLYHKGYTYTQIGVLFGLTRQRVHQIITGRNSDFYMNRPLKYETQHIETV